MTTHAGLVAAVEKVRWAAPFSDPPIVGETLGEVLAAILDLHTPFAIGDELDCECRDRWPCETVSIVAESLREIGAIE